jgi:hypothetical protein
MRSSSHIFQPLILCSLPFTCNFCFVALDMCIGSIKSWQSQRAPIASLHLMILHGIICKAHFIIRMGATFQTSSERSRRAKVCSHLRANSALKVRRIPPATVEAAASRLPLKHAQSRAAPPPQYQPINAGHRPPPSCCLRPAGRPPALSTAVRTPPQQRQQRQQWQ